MPNKQYTKNTDTWLQARVLLSKRAQSATLLRADTRTVSLAPAGGVTQLALAHPRWLSGERRLTATATSSPAVIASSPPMQPPVPHRQSLPLHSPLFSFSSALPHLLSPLNPAPSPAAAAGGADHCYGYRCDGYRWPLPLALSLRRRAQSARQSRPAPASAGGMAAAMAAGSAGRGTLPAAAPRTACAAKSTQVRQRNADADVKLTGTAADELVHYVLGWYHANYHELPARRFQTMQFLTSASTVPQAFEAVGLHNNIIHIEDGTPTCSSSSRRCCSAMVFCALLYLVMRDLISEDRPSIWRTEGEAGDADGAVRRAVDCPGATARGETPFRRPSPR